MNDATRHNGTMVDVQTPNTRTNDTEQQALDDTARSNRFFYEINLLWLEGYYFCFDPKEAAKRRGEQKYIALAKVL